MRHPASTNIYIDFVLIIFLKLVSIVEYLFSNVITSYCEMKNKCFIISQTSTLIGQTISDSIHHYDEFS